MKTIVKCSFPGCRELAAVKVAAPWKDGSNAELSTYGYACPDHAEAVVADAEGHARAYHLAPGEFVGEISTFPLPNLETMAFPAVIAAR